MASRFDVVYFIRNNGGTYEAWRDDDATGMAIAYSGTSLVTNVLNAIESAHSSGKFMVIFDEGQFDMGTENWTLNTVNDVTIQGAGIGITHVFNSSTAAADTEPFSFTNCDRITISDMDVTAGGTERSTSDAIDFDNSDDCLVQRVRVLGSRASGIVFDGKDSGAQALRNRVVDCVVTGTLGTAGHGIKTIAADRTEIRGCTVYDTVGDGIAITKASNTAGRPNQPSRDTRIIGTSVYNCGRDGIRMVSSSRTTITGCTVLNSADDTASRDGIRIESADSIQCDYTIIEGCIIGDDQGTPTQRYGVNVAPTTPSEAVGTVIANNVFFNNTSRPINRAGTRTIIKNNTGAPDKIAKSVSANTTLNAADPEGIIHVDTSGGAITITLPSSTAATGRGYIIRRRGASNVVINRAGSDTFEDAATSKTLAANDSSIGIYTLGAGTWWITATKGTVT